MAKSNETGHVVNLANLQDLKLACDTFGAHYNPVKVAISITGLDQLIADGRSALQNVSTHVAAYNNAVNARRQLFADLKPLATRIINCLQVTDASAEKVKDAKGFNRKIQGGRASKLPAAAVAADGTSIPDTKTVSTSQQSYNQQVEHLNNLVSLLAAEPSYIPNEAELKVATLQTLVTNMRASNTAASVAYAKITAARIARNELFYNPNTGLYVASLEVKKYVKAVFGASSPQYKQISGIAFTNSKI